MQIQGEKTQGVKFVGPIGIGKIMTDALDQGLVNFLMFLSMISIWLAVFNILPIPALDGGKLLFLAIEKIKGKAVNPKTEQKITFNLFWSFTRINAFCYNKRYNWIILK